MPKTPISEPTSWPTEKAGWDKELLAIELQGLIELDVAIELTGFEMAEIDLILEETREAAGAANGPEDTVPERSPVVRSAKLETCGCSRLLCGMRETKPPTIICWKALRRNSCLPIRRVWLTTPGCSEKTKRCTAPAS